MALAVLARPHYAACLPTLALSPPLHAQQRRWKIATATVAAVALALAAIGSVNLAAGYQFRVPPWQGAHGSWVGDGEFANGIDGSSSCWRDRTTSHVLARPHQQPSLHAKVRGSPRRPGNGRG